MLEIILLIFLTRHVGEIVESKGRRKTGWYKLMTVLLWLGGEVMGAIAGGIVAALSGSGNFVVYICALLGAAAGAGISVLIARSLSVVSYDQPPQPPSFGGASGPQQAPQSFGE
jgi:membrane protein DedA with SNARE-associated domain